MICAQNSQIQVTGQGTSQGFEGICLQTKDYEALTMRLLPLQNNWVAKLQGIPELAGVRHFFPHPSLSCP